MSRYRHVLLDRDGVLNRERESGWITRIADWEWEPNAREALRLLATAGMRISVVTNQSCIGRGVARAEEVSQLHRHVAADLAALGVGIAGFFVCPHAPEASCRCRKPAPGLVLDAVAASGIPAAHTVFAGDAERDLLAGRAAGVDVALIRSGKGGNVNAPGVPAYVDLLDAARAWLGEDNL